MDTLVDVARSISLGYTDGAGNKRFFPLVPRMVNRVPDAVWESASKVRSSNGRGNLENLAEARIVRTLTPAQAAALAAGEDVYLIERVIVPPAQVGALRVAQAQASASPLIVPNADGVIVDANPAAAAAVQGAAQAAAEAAADPEKAAIESARARARARG